MWVSKDLWFDREHEIAELTKEIGRLNVKVKREENDTEYYKQRYYLTMQDYIDLVKATETVGIDPAKLRKYAAAKQHHDELHSVVLSIPEEVAAKPEPEA